MKFLKLNDQELIEIMATKLLQRENQRHTATPPPVGKSRYIPATIKQKIYMRDKGQCLYINPKTKQKCNSRHQLELDHIYPHALGGENTVKNLRLVCRNHNQFYVSRIFASPQEMRKI